MSQRGPDPGTTRAAFTMRSSRPNLARPRKLPSNAHSDVRRQNGLFGARCERGDTDRSPSKAPNNAHSVIWQLSTAFGPRTSEAVHAVVTPPQAGSVGGTLESRRGDVRNLLRRRDLRPTLRLLRAG